MASVFVETEPSPYFTVIKFGYFSAISKTLFCSPVLPIIIFFPLRIFNDRSDDNSINSCRRVRRMAPGDSQIIIDRPGAPPPGE